jgi:hypothetical protein
MAEVIGARLREALAGILGGYWKFDRRITVQVTVTIPANAAVNSALIPSFVIDPKAGSTTSYPIPKGYRFVLVDAYIRSSGDAPVDGILRLKRNFYEERVILGPISTMLVSNPTRPAVSPKHWDEGDTLSMEFNNLVAGGSAATTNTIFLVFDVYTKD